MSFEALLQPVLELLLVACRQHRHTQSSSSIRLLDGRSRISEIRVVLVHLISESAWSSRVGLVSLALRRIGSDRSIALVSFLAGMFFCFGSCVHPCMQLVYSACERICKPFGPRLKMLWLCSERPWFADVRAVLAPGLNLPVGGFPCVGGVAAST